MKPGGLPRSFGLFQALLVALLGMGTAVVAAIITS